MGPGKCGATPAFLVAELAARDPVLVVDRDARVRNVVIQWVGALGHPAYVAANAEDALRIMETVPIDVVIGDICMPTSDGRWFLDRLRGEHPHAAIVVSTGVHDSKSSLTAGRGVAGYRLHTFDREDLAIAMNQARRQRDGRRSTASLRMARLDQFTNGIGKSRDRLP